LISRCAIPISKLQPDLLNLVKLSIRSISFIALGMLACLLAGCTGNPDVRAMSATHAVALHRTGQPVQTMVINGTVRDGRLPNIQNEDFRQALEVSLVRSGLFTSVGVGGFRLEAFITSIEHARVGDKLRVDMEVRYALRRRSLVVWRKLVRSDYEAPIKEVLPDLVRVREATKGAARGNIELLIRLLDKQRL
jgi:hypothetical protein